MVLKKSALVAALVLFLAAPAHRLHAGMPLTETINTIPEGDVEVSARADYIRAGHEYRRESFSLGLGILPWLSLWYNFQYLHRGFPQPEKNQLGDTFFKLWFYIGDYFRDVMHAGLLVSFRMPTGADAYTDPEWRALSFGNSELKIGPVIQVDAGRVILHFNAFYVFRQGQDEAFYSRIYLNPLRKVTYAKFFGLNFFAKDTFAATDRLKDDYVIVSAAVNTGAVYPFIPFLEMYGARRVYSGRGSLKDLPLEGAGISPILCSAGIRYFFSGTGFAGLYGIINPRREREYIRSVIGLDISLQF